MLILELSTLSVQSEACHVRFHGEKKILNLFKPNRKRTGLSSTKGFALIILYYLDS